ncbi:MlaA family lipoprotein [Rickettsia endosymbiont of Cardiosporidium cionae]|uniref:MlaA family lipoprotein n=1 Tax=Rickettsia endosymbiont of Cardiosporidium cionae TaxID=2777155 RepID=UPI001895B7C3|nr:VacJ family lipoprotein [Rickettsia endosymbiont of Cardiosporidium cionae]KAF8818123.1 hypothetical protein IHI24_000852 [Rickettsia endosymbiont of Cardiosporidium cionae]
MYKLVIIVVLIIYPFVGWSSYREGGDTSIKDNHLDYSYLFNEKDVNMNDPYEAFNRRIFKFNNILDKYFIRYLALFYTNVTNDYFKSRVTHFTENIFMPISVIHYSLQGNSTNALKSFWRFVINTTFGIFGMFDIASLAGLNVKTQSLGSTLKHYGATKGPYIVLPILGGMVARDLGSTIERSIFDASSILGSKTHWTVLFLNLLNKRSSVLKLTDSLENNALDLYTVHRELIYNYKY